MAYIKTHWYVSGRIIFQFESAVAVGIKTDWAVSTTLT